MLFDDLSDKKLMIYVYMTKAFTRTSSSHAV